jgi:hypothetical protein
MSRRKKPYAALLASGSVAHDPGRYAGREDEVRVDTPLGDPPKRFKPDQRAVWNEIAASAPPNTLTGADRFLVEVLAILMAEFRKVGPEMPAAQIAKMTECMGKLGMTPVDRVDLRAPKKPRESRIGALIANLRGNGPHPSHGSNNGSKSQ